MTNKISIQEVDNEYHDHFLDVIGNEFKFDHVKGMAEWLKNSVDAYFREDVPQVEQYIIFKFTDQEVPIVECIDFVGMEQTDIDKAFKRWGDPDAAKRGGKVKVYGGHGNGGKFYMRQMFQKSFFITYKKGVLNIFGFSDNKKYGYAEDYKDKKMTPKEALAFADINSLPIPVEIKQKVLDGKTGFTVIRGVGPEGVRGKFKMSKEMERFKNHPQSRRILLRANVSILYNGSSMYGLLKPDELDPLEKFETSRLIDVPTTLSIHSGNENATVELANAKYPQGKLVLRTSSEALVKGTKLGELNRIDVLGEIGVIGSYQLFEMGVTGFPDAAFIYGECEVPILESSENDCVSNDRAKLVKNETTDALVTWIAQEVDKLAAEITALKREKQKESQKDITSKFNDVLNQWKNKHMKKIMSELFGGDSGNSGEGSGIGFVGGEITPPLNGFDFKYPKAEVQIDIPAKITLKVSVPEALPIGAVIQISSDNDCVFIEKSKYHIKSDYLKSNPDGHEVAYINIEVVGQKLGSAILTATAGKLSSLIQLTVIEQKEDHSKLGKQFPRVLLSGHDFDPLGLAPDGTLYLGERDPVVFQRRLDVEQGIYWINTQSALALKIYDKFKNFDSIQWRNFLFDRYVDIFVKESIHELWKKDYENFNYDSVDQKIADTIRKTHENAKEDLGDFLFEESYVIKVSEKDEI